MSLESVIKKELDLSVLKSTGLGGGGCISQGSAFDTDKYGRIFVKVNPKSGVCMSGFLSQLFYIVTAY